MAHLKISPEYVHFLRMSKVNINSAQEIRQQPEWPQMVAVLFSEMAYYEHYE